MGLFDRFRKNNNDGTENHAVIDVDTNEDRLTPEELSRRSREIAAELEAEQKRVQEIYNQTQAMFAQHNKRMDEIHNSPETQDLDAADLRYLDKLLGKDKLSPEQEALVEQERRRLAREYAEDTAIEQRKSPVPKSTEEKRVYHAGGVRKEKPRYITNRHAVEKHETSDTLSQSSVENSSYYNNGSSHDEMSEMFEPGKNIHDNTSVSTQQIGQSSVSGNVSSSGTDQTELGRMLEPEKKVEKKSDDDILKNNSFF